MSMKNAPYMERLSEISAKGNPLVPGSPEEKAAVERFKDFFAELSADRIRAKIRDVYTDDVYFNDTLKEVHGVDALEPYLLESAAAVESCTVDVKDVAVAGGNYYVRWVMDIRFKRFKKGALTRSIGMSHIRFDENGKIVLHQDYWDSAAGLFEHLPLVGYLIRKIKGRL